MVITAYRGEHGKVPDLATRHGAITFCNEFRSCEEYARFPNNPKDQPNNPRVLIGTVIINNPFIVQPLDPFLEGSYLECLLGYDETVRILCKFSDHVEHTNQWESICQEYPGITVADYLALDRTHIQNVYFSAYPYFDCAEEVQKLMQLSYDGAITGSVGLSAGAVEYRPFSIEQVTVQYVVKL